MLKYLSKGQVAGLALFIAGFVVIMGIITAEAYYPSGYSTAQNEISDLGATRPPDSVIYQPSSLIFNISMVVTGLLIVGAALNLRFNKFRKLFIIPLAIFGLGVLGVGLFPGNTTPHPLFAMLTFISGGLAAILSAKVISGPFRFAAVFLGVTALVALFFSGLFIPHIGDGGTERWIAYPITLWLIGLGGYLLAPAPASD